MDDNVVDCLARAQVAEEDDHMDQLNQQLPAARSASSLRRPGHESPDASASEPLTVDRRVPASDDRRLRRFGAIGAAAVCLLVSVALLLSGWHRHTTSQNEPHDDPTVALASHTTPRTTTKAIKDIKIGDVVLAKDPATGEVLPKKVTRVFHNMSDHLRILTIRSGDQSEQRIETTDEHPFWVGGKGWVEAGDLSIGDKVSQSDGQPATLIATERESHDAGIPVYNIEVEGVHTYFVAAHGSRAPPVLVHNCNVPAPGRKVYTSTDFPADLSRRNGTFVTDVDITQPKNVVRHVDANVPPSHNRPPGNLPRYVTEIDVPPGSVLPDPTVPYRPNSPSGWLPSNPPAANVNRVYEVIEDAAGNVNITPLGK